MIITMSYEIPYYHITPFLQLFAVDSLFVVSLAVLLAPKEGLVMGVILAH